MPISKQEISQDIEVARESLHSAGLLDIASAHFLCELYRRPAHNHSTLYARVYASKGRILVTYARPEVFQLGQQILMSAFEYAAKANAHGGAKGAIVCGMRYLDGFNASEVRTQLEGLEDSSVPEVSGFVLDDESCYVRSRATDVVFRSSCKDEEFPGCNAFHFFIQLMEEIEVLFG